MVEGRKPFRLFQPEPNSLVVDAAFMKDIPDLSLRGHLETAIVDLRPLMQAPIPYLLDYRNGKKMKAFGLPADQGRRLLREVVRRGIIAFPEIKTKGWRRECPVHHMSTEATMLFAVIVRDEILHGPSLTMEQLKEMVKRVRMLLGTSVLVESLHDPQPIERERAMSKRTQG